MQNPPLPNTAPSCGLATASLVCGVCGVICGPFAGIPAIITGHLALSRIKKSGGALQGKGRAVAGLVMGYVSTFLLGVIAVLGAAGFAAGNAAIVKARKITTTATATSVEVAVNAYLTEYGSMPRTGTADVTVKTDADTELLRVLLGMEKRELNKRSIRFLSVKEGKNQKNGLIYTTDGNGVVGLYDPWGGGYHVRLDLDADNKLDVGGEVLENRRVAVWSDGPDRKPGTQDDVKTW
jgi:hypothetical protein